MPLIVIRLTISLVLLGSSIWVLIDATSLGAKRGVLGGGFLDSSAAGWFVGCFFFWIIAFPMYLIVRPRLVAARDARLAAGMAPRQHLALASQAPPMPYGYPPPPPPLGYPAPAQRYSAYPPPPLAAPSSSASPYFGAPQQAFAAPPGYPPPPAPYPPAPYPPAPYAVAPHVGPPALDPAAAPAPASPEVVAELEHLRQQHRAGEISIVEFIARKKQLG